MMKMYKQPKIEVSAFETELMQDIITVSPGNPTDPNNPPTPGAPARGDVID